MIILSTERTPHHAPDVQPERRVRADFTGLFGDILCLSHDELFRDEAGAIVAPGDTITAFDEGDDLVASGTVHRAPAWLACKGSRWVLRIDARGVVRTHDRR